MPPAAAALLAAVFSKSDHDKTLLLFALPKQIDLLLPHQTSPFFFPHSNIASHPPVVNTSHLISAQSCSSIHCDKHNNSFHNTSTMHSIFLLLIAAVLTALGAQATPQAQPTKTCTNSSSIAVATPFTAPATEPTGPFQVYGYRQGYDVVHQFWNAEGQKFYLGGSPSTYCPSNIQNLTGCPPGDATVFSGLDELV